MRVVIGEDQVLLRRGLVALLEDSGFEVVGQAGDAVDLVHNVSAHKAEVVVASRCRRTTATMACAPAGDPATMPEVLRRRARGAMGGVSSSRPTLAVPGG